GGRMALDRGIPFGDITGLLRGGDPNGGGGRGGGPGGPGSGALVGPRSGGGGSAASAHIVYVLDTSGSMREGNKIGKAREALKKALSELKPKDTFNIVNFDGGVHQFAGSMQSATGENVRNGMAYVDAIVLQSGTNVSGALERALSHDKITHLFLLSDGEPSRGITDPGQLRALVRERNRQKAQILTLALGLGEQFPGIPLLKGLAEDNNGKFSYVNLSK
ncbi:MAG TPA: VWA domain-containing protein, partial [Armatimonadota bacterium]|nr:VWA domain-containing protein [Armatimonadota bacterium]